MSSFESILNLRKFDSCRDETIPRETIGEILEAGRHAPSPGNIQTLEFIVVESEDQKERLAEITGDRRVEEAPSTVIVVSDIERMRNKIGGSEASSACNTEAAFAVQNMRLVAYENNLASVLISGFESETVARKFDIPEGKKAFMLVSFGYTDDPITTEHKFGLNQITFYDTYGRQIKSAFEGPDWRGVKEERRIYRRKAKGLKDKVKRSLRKVL